jgi:muconolactone delta-isomerase
MAPDVDPETVQWLNEREQVRAIAKRREAAASEAIARQWANVSIFKLDPMLAGRPHAILESLPLSPSMEQAS